MSLCQVCGEKVGGGEGKGGGRGKERRGRRERGEREEREGSDSVRRDRERLSVAAAGLTMCRHLVLVVRIK